MRKDRRVVRRVRGRGIAKFRRRWRRDFLVPPLPNWPFAFVEHQAPWALRGAPLRSTINRDRRTSARTDGVKMNWLTSLFSFPVPASDALVSKPTEKQAAKDAAPAPLELSQEEQLAVDAIRARITAVQELCRAREASRAEILRDMREARRLLKEIERLAEPFPVIELIGQDRSVEAVCAAEARANSNATPHELAKTWLEDCLILDTETTGLSDSDEIVEIVIIDHNGEVKLSTTVRPTCPISPSATAVHGITEEDVANSPFWSEIHPQVMNLLRLETVISYNAEFDTRILRQTAWKSGKECGPLHIGCVMSAYAQYYGDWNDRHGSWTFQALDRAVAQQGITIKGQLHRAHTDCRATLALIEAMATRPVHDPQVERYPDDLESMALKRAGVPFGTVVDACVRYAEFSGWNSSKSAAEGRAEAFVRSGLGAAGEALYWSQTGVDGLAEWKAKRAALE